MFGFGLFSTHLPYLLLTAIYLIYFGVFALNRFSQSEQENQETNTSNTQFISSTTVPVDGYDYTAQHDEPSGISQDNFVLNHFIQKLCIKGISPPGYVSVPSGQIYSRPPPFKVGSWQSSRQSAVGILP